MKTNVVDVINNLPNVSAKIVFGRTEDDPFGTPGQSRYKVTITWWPLRGYGQWGFYRCTAKEAYQLARSVSRLSRSPYANGDCVGDSIFIE